MALNFTPTKRFLLLLNLLLLAIGSQAAIYRPATSNDLINDIETANASAEDDIIDLQGNIFVFAANCATTDGDSDTTCLSEVNALPVISPVATGGRLYIVNGGIERDDDPDDDPDTDDANDFRLIEVAAEANLSLFNITLRNGNAVGLGGEEGILEVIADDGGAIYNFGYLSIQNSTLANNTADLSGGAIYNAVGATLVMQSSNINGNFSNNNEDGTRNGGGGIFNVGIIAGISNSTITNNQTAGFGAGINNQGEAHHIFNSTISTNYACISVEGGICPEEAATGRGGGIYNDSTATVLQIINSTISGNHALEGGGAFNDSVGVVARINDNIPTVTTGVHFYNTTISNNTAYEGGGGIYNTDLSSAEGNPPATIENLVSTIVANNTDTQLSTAEDYAPDLFDGAVNNVTNESNNLIGNNAGSQSTFTNGVNEDIVGTDVAPIDPMLGALGFNEGFTDTMALLPGSPAINKGLNPFALFYDQRRKPFKRVKCSRPDIGAYELQRCF
jgi:hypothetical protein